MMEPKRVIVIGGGSTGCATAHDLTLRGFEVVLIERGEIASGTTGRCRLLFAQWRALRGQRQGIRR